MRAKTRHKLSREIAVEKNGSSDRYMRRVSQRLNPSCEVADYAFGSNPPYGVIEGFSHFVTSMTAPIASGWSDCRVGLAPTGKRRLCTAHTRSGHREKNRWLTR
jgi:hypothetical protein